MTSPVFTIGHGTRSTEELVAILASAGVGRVIDVRRFPGSRRHPHFNREQLERSLPAHGIAYDWRGEALGGRRRAASTSRHPAWRNESFRAYADYMDSSGFEGALEELEAAARDAPPLTLMCAETLWWRCHRRLIADALVAHGFEVVHLLGIGNRGRHELDEHARVEDGKVVYDRGVAGRFEL